MDSTEDKKGPNKINISSSSLVALKAELLHKKAQVQQARAEGLTNVRLKPAKKKLKPGEKGNKGVEQRALRDEVERTTEEPSLEKSRIMLEEKAKLYESLSKDRGLLGEDTISEEQSFFLVNFQQKVIEDVVKERRAQSSKTSARPPPSSSSSSDDEAGNEADYPASNADEEWVDYVDSFGRTRRCLRKDLPVFQQADAELKKTPGSTSTTSSASYNNFVKSADSAEGPSSSTLAQEEEEARRLRREKWEQDAEENARKSKLHYQDILFQEARQHGVGFYAFSKDEEERAKQMEELERIRKQTEASRSAVVQTAGTKKAAMEARLKKVRERKRQKLGLPPLKEKPAAPQPPPEEAKPSAEERAEKESEEEEARRKAAAALPKSVKIRPWDMGKEGVPSMKKPEMLQTAWVEKRREERPMEFAPPSAYAVASASRSSRPGRQYPPPPPQQPPPARQKAPSPEPSESALTEESIAAGLAFFKNFPVNPRESKVETKFESFVAEEPEEEEENDDDLLPPGESPECSGYRPPQRSGAAIPPPTSMDYYSNAKSGPRPNRGGGRIDLTESFRQGLANRK